MTSYCFVIQPFNPKYNKRFDDVFAPAIKEAGLDPYRVDRDPSVDIPIDEIETRIRNASLCLADITEDNPNVWYELGYALASSKDVCLLSANDRTGRFPFDIQHRNIIRYDIESPSDFNQLSGKIVDRILAITKRQETIGAIQEVSRSPSEGDVEVSELDLICLAIVAGELSGIEGSVTFWSIRNAMNQAGYNSLATSMSLRRLLHANRVTSSKGFDGDGDEYHAYSISDEGWSALERNVHRINLQNKSSKKGNVFALDDEIPF